MPAPKELERLSGLFSLASDTSRPFLERCSETKYMAVRDYNRATSVTVELAKQTLREANSGLTSHVDCKRYFVSVGRAIESGQIDTRVIHTLEKLRSTYLEKVLKPAVRTYLEDDQLKTTEIERLYNDALRIEGILEVVQFLKKVKPVV